MSDLAAIPQAPLEETQTVHIVFVHGFRGDHTTFQSFPSDLHNHLLSDIPGLQTWVYPTYKSAKPLSFAVTNLLGWLKSIPPGPVILAGHSMGGLLVAEAATHPSSIARRITGILAFDTPYLGMHPHVVVSGIASLFLKKDDDKGKKKDDKSKINVKPHSEDPGPPAPSAEGMESEQAVNDEGIVNFITSADAYPRPGAGRSGDLSPISTVSQLPSYHGVTLSPPLSPRPTSSTSPSTAQSGTSGVSSFLSSATSFFKTHADDPFIRFLNKHSDAPVAAMSRWVVEYFEFGWAMFDYPNLLDRYEKLENWDGDWVCFWTVTGGEEMGADEVMGDGERPPTPRKRKKLASPGERFENDFERAMRAAVEKEERRKSKEVEKQAQKAERERAEREKARRKKEEEEEKQRKKEEEAQERERQKAAEAQEKERRKATELKEKERKAKEEAEKKERARIAKEEAKRAKEAAKAAKKAQGKDTSEDPSPESQDPVIEHPTIEPEQASENPPPSSSTGDSTTDDSRLPKVLVEGADIPSKLEGDGDDEEEDADDKSVAASFKTALETHHPDSRIPSPAHSSASSAKPSSSRPPSSEHEAAHHFITLPGKLHPRQRKHWLKVRIAGVEDEVAAHCGLFIRAQNLEYERFLERVGVVVKSWVL